MMGGDKMDQSLENPDRINKYIDSQDTKDWTYSEEEITEMDNSNTKYFHLGSTAVDWYNHIPRSLHGVWKIEASSGSYKGWLAFGKFHGLGILWNLNVGIGSCKEKGIFFNGEFVKGIKLKYDNNGILVATTTVYDSKLQVPVVTPVTDKNKEEDKYTPEYQNREIQVSSSTTDTKKEPPDIKTWSVAQVDEFFKTHLSHMYSYGIMSQSKLEQYNIDGNTLYHMRRQDFIAIGHLDIINVQLLQIMIKFRELGIKTKLVEQMTDEGY